MMFTSYTIDSDFGVFEPDGNAMLMRRGNQHDGEAYDPAESSIRSALTRENIMIP